MAEDIKIQVIKDIIYLIDDGVSIIYNGEKYDHIFSMIFGSFFIEIAIDYGFSQVSISVFKGSSPNHIDLDSGDPGVSDLISILRNKFDLNEYSYIKEFSETVRKYSQGEDISNSDMEVKLNKLISSERYEEAEELKKKISDQRKRKRNGKK